MYSHLFLSLRQTTNVYITNMLQQVENDILQIIPDEDLPKLRDIFINHWPYAMHAYYFVDNYIEWKKREITDTVFMCPEGRWDDGTFIAVEDEDSTYGIFVFTLEKSCDRLRMALTNSKILKWDNKNLHIYFMCVHEAHQPTVFHQIEAKGFKTNHLDNGDLWWISKEDALKFTYEIPQDMYIGELKAIDVNTIDAVWPHHSTYSNSYLRVLVVNNGGFGLYSKFNNTLCSWVVRNNYGALAILQTVEEHRNKGYAQTLIKYFCKRRAKKGHDIYATIMKHNMPSKTLFGKLGFKKEHGVAWIQIERAN